MTTMKSDYVLDKLHQPSDTAKVMPSASNSAPTDLSRTSSGSSDKENLLVNSTILNEYHQCNGCRVDFASINEYKDHIDNSLCYLPPGLVPQDGAEAIYTCYTCSLTFTAIKDYGFHIYNVDCSKPKQNQTKTECIQMPDKPLWSDIARAEANNVNHAKSNTSPLYEVNEEPFISIDALQGNDDHHQPHAWPDTQPPPASSPRPIYCHVCNCPLPDAAVQEAHFKSSAHNQRLEELSDDKLAALEVILAPVNWCPLCCAELPTGVRRRNHCQDSPHVDRLAILRQRVMSKPRQPIPTNNNNNITQPTTDQASPVTAIQFVRRCDLCNQDQVDHDHLKAVQHVHALKALVQSGEGDQLQNLPSATSWCPICAVDITSDIVKEAHCKGKKHIRKFNDQLALYKQPQLANPSNESSQKVPAAAGQVIQKVVQKFMHCALCNIDLEDRQAGNEHIKSSQHLASKAALSQSAAESLRSLPGSTDWCPLCATVLSSEAIRKAHCEGRMHCDAVEEVIEAFESLQMSNAGDSPTKSSTQQQPKPATRCDLCHVYLADRTAGVDHLASSQHQDSLATLPVGQVEALRDLPDSCTWCPLCATNVAVEVSRKSHCAGSMHRIRLEKLMRKDLTQNGNQLSNLVHESSSEPALAESPSDESDSEYFSSGEQDDTPIHVSSSGTAIAELSSGESDAEYYSCKEKKNKTPSLLARFPVAPNFRILFCSLCSCNLSGQKIAKEHFKSKGHLEEFQKLSIEEYAELARLPHGWNWCPLCCTILDKDHTRRAHTMGRNHRLTHQDKYTVLMDGKRGDRTSE